MGAESGKEWSDPDLQPALEFLLQPHLVSAGAGQVQPATSGHTFGRLAPAQRSGEESYWILPQGIGKRSPAPEPDAEGHTLDLSMTANMDTLRQRLIFALRNRASQAGGRDLE